MTQCNCNDKNIIKHYNLLTALIIRFTFGVHLNLIATFVGSHSLLQNDYPPPPKKLQTFPYIEILLPDDLMLSFMTQLPFGIKNNKVA